MDNIFKKEKGFTLLEMLISILIVTIGVLGIYQAVYKYNKKTQIERESFIAAYLCQEGIEIIKNIRDSNWVAETAWNSGLETCIDTVGCEADYSLEDAGALTLWSSPGRSLYIDGSTGFYKYGNNTGDIETPYVRKIEILSQGTDELDITVTVYWKTNSMVVKENLYNWK